MSEARQKKMRSSAIEDILAESNEIFKKYLWNYRIAFCNLWKIARIITRKGRVIKIKRSC